MAVALYRPVPPPVEPSEGSRMEEALAAVVVAASQAAVHTKPTTPDSGGSQCGECTKLYDTPGTEQAAQVVVVEVVVAVLRYTPHTSTQRSQGNAACSEPI